MNNRLVSFLLIFFAWSLSGIAQSHRITVNKYGQGDFRTIQEAIYAVQDSSSAVTTILIKPGVYKEKLRLPESKWNVHFIGEDVNNTILTYDDYAQKKDSSGKETGTSGSSSFFIFGEGFSAENITFQNSAGPVGQAVAIRITGDRARFINCRFLGFQDTLYTHGAGSRQYYLKCHIEGTVDFIFGSATALFDSCVIFGKRGGYFTAPSTPEGTPFGYVFRNCRFTGDAPDGSFYLGRPWRPNAKVLIMNCYLGPIVNQSGWDNWGNPENEKTAQFSETSNHGEGAVMVNRVAWMKKPVSIPTITEILGGWNPLPNQRTL